MSRRHATPKSRVSLTLDQDLVRRSRALTANLSGTVAHLLAGFVAGTESVQRDSAAHTAACFDALDSLHAALADDFPGL